MLYMPKKFNSKELKVYLCALTYILNLNSQDNKIKKDYFLLQVSAAGISKEKCEGIHFSGRQEDLIKRLKSLEDIRVQRYIIREMIMLAIADHDISEEEIRVIYKVAESIGISGEKVGDFFIWAAKGIEWKIEGTQLVEEDL